MNCCCSMQLHGHPNAIISCCTDDIYVDIYIGQVPENLCMNIVCNYIEIFLIIYIVSETWFLPLRYTVTCISLKWIILRYEAACNPTSLTNLFHLFSCTHRCRLLLFYCSPVCFMHASWMLTISTIYCCTMICCWRNKTKQTCTHTSEYMFACSCFSGPSIIDVPAVQMTIN